MTNTDTAFDTLEKRIFNTFMERNPTMAIRFGIHKFDDKLPHFTREKYEKDIELMEKWKKEVENIDSQELSKEFHLRNP